jgi:hypothetical protein
MLLERARRHVAESQARVVCQELRLGEPERRGHTVILPGVHVPLEHMQNPLRQSREYLDYELAKVLRRPVIFRLGRGEAAR